MDFIDRLSEIGRLEDFRVSEHGRLAVIWGRRRVGKTRLLLEWTKRNSGIYIVGEQSSEVLQREYFAEALEAKLPGFASVQYPSWRTLLERLAKEARSINWRGPLIIDELPYFVLTSPELPSQLQRWLDHEAKDAKLKIALAGSSQKMMQGLALNHDSPLFGRAQEMLALGPLAPGYLPVAFPKLSYKQIVELYSVIGGIPHYWELAQDCETSDIFRIVDRLMLDAHGPLHSEPDRLLMEEIPSAVSLRPVLDAIGMGAHRPSEIAARTGMPVTSLPKILTRLIEMNFIEREISFGESEKNSKRSLYTIDAPLLSVWFKVVAPHRAFLTQAPSSARIAFYRNHHSSQVAGWWEKLCRMSVPKLHTLKKAEHFGPWYPARRYWHGTGPEFDIVAESIDGKKILLGECKWANKPVDLSGLQSIHRELLNKGYPASANIDGKEVVWAIFASEITRNARKAHGRIAAFDAQDIIESLK